MSDPQALYRSLNVPISASGAEIKRAYRTARTKAHPDKGGDAAIFHRLTEAYNVLSDPTKRAHYDATGQVQKSASEEFAEVFAGGAFADRVGRATAAATSVNSSVAEQIAVRQEESQKQSHTAGFEAWLRARGSNSISVFTADTVADTFGVVKSSYEAVPLAARSALTAVCKGPGKPKDQVEVVYQPLPAELEWGQVLVEAKIAPITPADVYTIRLGGVYDEDCRQPPFVSGHEFVAVVRQVGPGVKDLTEGDVVLPVVPLLGTWTEAAVVKAKHVVRVGRMAATPSQVTLQGGSAATDGDDLPLPLEYLAVHRELLLAYRLLEAHPSLKPGDCIILNAPNSTVGRTVLQLCKLLKLRAVAVLRVRLTSAAASGTPGRDDAWFERVAGQLQTFGATIVLKDEGSIKTQLSALRFFGRPKLALDAVGGESAMRLADALEQEGKVVVYGCMSGKPTAWTWQSWVFKGLSVSGYNLRKQLAAETPAGTAKLRNQLAALGKIIAAGLLSLDFTAYGFAEEFSDAIDHASEAVGGSRVVLTFNA
eukprot:gene2103-2422_t